VGAIRRKPTMDDTRPGSRGNAIASDCYDAEPALVAAGVMVRIAGPSHVYGGAYDDSGEDNDENGDGGSFHRPLVRWRSIMSWAALISAVILSARARWSGSENRSGWERLMSSRRVLSTSSIEAPGTRPSRS
jgi:hypothetical protein